MNSSKKLNNRIVKSRQLSTTRSKVGSWNAYTTSKQNIRNKLESMDISSDANILADFSQFIKNGNKNLIQNWTQSNLRRTLNSSQMSKSNRESSLDMSSKIIYSSKSPGNKNTFTLTQKLINGAEISRLNGKLRYNHARGKTHNEHTFLKNMVILGRNHQYL